MKLIFKQQQYQTDAVSNLVRVFSGQTKGTRKEVVGREGTYVQEIFSNKKIEFDIYGNIEDQEYVNTFKKNIKKHGKINIRYKGVLNPNDISSIYADSDFMLLPTMHENYGHAIVEAWANGCPVIISKYTPWKNLKIKNLGWDVDIDSKQNLVNTLQEAVDIDFTSYIQMLRASYNYFGEKICDNTVMQANQKVFGNENWFVQIQ